MRRKVGGTGRRRGRVNHNQDLLCEKKIYFSVRGKNWLLCLFHFLHMCVVCMCMSAWVWTHVCTCVHANEGLRLMFLYFSIVLYIVCWDQVSLCFPPPPQITVCAGLMSQHALGIPCLWLLSSETSEELPHPPSYYKDSGDPNSGPTLTRQVLYQLNYLLSMTEFKNKTKQNTTSNTITTITVTTNHHHHNNKETKPEHSAQGHTIVMAQVD